MTCRWVGSAVPEERARTANSSCACVAACSADSPRARKTSSNSLAWTSRRAIAASVLGAGSEASKSSRWEVTEMYSPAAIESAPASKPAVPAATTIPCEVPVAAIPRVSARFETSPSLAPKTPARNIPDMRSRDRAANPRTTSPWMCSSAAICAVASSSSS